MRGQRLIDYSPHGHWKTLTFIGALRHTGMTAPMVFDRPICGSSFYVWLEQCLLPTLNKGDVVIMDNLVCHKVAGIREMIKSVGARIFYLPPYSPDLNPIENCFSKIKAWLRKMKERTIDGIHNALGHILDTIKSSECKNYFNNAGYNSIY
jgi:transposase